MEFFEFASISEMLFYTDEYKRQLWAYMLIGALCFAMVYIFEAVALYTIAKRNGIKNKWMAFLPVLNTYYIGVVSKKNLKGMYVPIITAAAEGVYIFLNMLYYIALALIFKGGYAAPVYESTMIGNISVERVTGYAPVNLPESLNWAWWVFVNIDTYITYWVQLIYTIANVFLLVAFFRTYSSPRYILFSIVSVLFPVKGIFMFAVRNNAGKNYGQYINEQRQRQYNMYQDYMRRNGQYGGQGYNGGYQNGGYQNGQYGGTGHSGSGEDPFGGLGGNDNHSDGNPSGGAPDDPFGDL